LWRWNITRGFGGPKKSAKQSNRFLGRSHDTHQVSDVGRGKAVGDDVIDKSEKRIEESTRVDKHDRLGVGAQLCCRHRLREFIKRAQPARQDNERICCREHSRFAFVHVARDDELVGNGERRLHMAQEVGNNPRNLAAAFAHGARNLAHQTHAAAAKDEIEAVACHERAKAPRSVGIGGIIAVIGAAEDAKSGPHRGLAVRYCVVHGALYNEVDRPSRDRD